mmetsp:Transcript_16005/g.28754  ORF Transcript_16005/g.28754 Transcript_16005/m.28754 type:complete len:382 (-) Transcript_16005:525-1670(-)
MLRAFRAGGLLASSFRKNAFSTALFSRQFHDVGQDERVNLIFNRNLKQYHRDRAAFMGLKEDPLVELVTSRLLDRLEDCTSKFNTIAILGGSALSIIKNLPYKKVGIEKIICIDSSIEVLECIKNRVDGMDIPNIHYVVADDEFLPIKAGSVDAIISSLGLHWANDLPGAMIQCCRALRPDGLFLSALFGGDSLFELRVSCALASQERMGGVSSVVSPLMQVRDAGNLLTRAGLAIPAVDVDTFTINYPSPMHVIDHLRSLGESNAHVHRAVHLKRETALATAAAYQTLFPAAPTEGGSDGVEEEGAERKGVTATFEVVFMTGWAPAPNQPKAKRRGSATVSMQVLADGLKDTGALIGGADEEAERLTKEDRSGDKGGKPQ